MPAPVQFPSFQPQEELRRLLPRLYRHRWLHRVPLRVLALVVFAAAGLGLMGALVVFTGGGAPLTWQRLVATLALSVPAFLVLGAVLTSVGTWVCNRLFKMSDQERRFVALYLPRKVSARLGWCNMLTRWLHTGRLLVQPKHESPNAYIHAFLCGVAPSSAGATVALWERLATVLPYRLRPLCYPGAALRRLQTVRALPKWSQVLEDVADGRQLGEMLDHHYGDWAQRFLARARQRLGVAPGMPVDFFLTYVPVDRQGSALVVAVYPRAREAENRAAVADAA